LKQVVKNERNVWKSKVLTSAVCAVFDYFGIDCFSTDCFWADYFGADYFGADCFSTGWSFVTDWNVLKTIVNVVVDLICWRNFLNCCVWKTFWMNLPPTVVTRRFPPSKPVTASSESNVSGSGLFSGSS